MQLGRYRANAPLQCPDAFAIATASPENAHVIGVSLRVVANDQAQQGALARAVGPSNAQLSPRRTTQWMFSKIVRLP